MKLKNIILVSIITAAILAVPVAYSLWERSLSIKGTIEVIEPESMSVTDAVYSISDIIYGKDIVNIPEMLKE